MIKTETVVVPHVKATTKEVKIYICDFCGHTTKGDGQSTYSRSVSTCILCERHSCNGRANSCTQWYDPYGGDYPDPYCKICYELRFVKYSKLIDDIQEDADNQIDLIIEGIKKESLELGKTEIKKPV